MTLDIKIPTKISFKSSVTVPPPKIPTPQNEPENDTSDADTIESDQDTTIKNEATPNQDIDSRDPDYDRTFKSGREYDLRDDPDAIVCPT